MWNLKGKEYNSRKQSVEKWLPGPGRWGKSGAIGRRIATFSCRMDTVGGSTA